MSSLPHPAADKTRLSSLWTHHLQAECVCLSVLAGAVCLLCSLVYNNHIQTLTLTDEALSCSQNKRRRHRHPLPFLLTLLALFVGTQLAPASSSSSSSCRRIWSAEVQLTNNNNNHNNYNNNLSAVPYGLAVGLFLTFARRCLYIWCRCKGERSAAALNETRRGGAGDSLHLTPSLAQLRPSPSLVL